MSGRTLSAIAVPVVCLAAVAQGDVVRDSTGYPGNPGYVSGGRVMYSYKNGGNFQATGFRGLTLTRPTTVQDIQGVMAASNPAFNWASGIASIRINVFSSEQAFAASPLLGDVYTQSGASIQNLTGGFPPAWGGVNNGGWTNRWVDLQFSPFVLQPGTYILSVLFTINSGFLAWTETLHDFGLPGDIGKSGLDGANQFWEYSGRAGYTTGDAAVRIEVTPVAPACAADMGSTGGTPGPDGVLDNNDFIVFIDAFFASNPAADFGATGGVLGPDGHFDNNDFVVFIDRFFAGCGA